MPVHSGTLFYIIAHSVLILRMAVPTYDHLTVSPLTPDLLDLYGFERFDGFMPVESAKVIGIADTNHAVRLSSIGTLLNRMMRPDDALLIEGMPIDKILDHYNVHHSSAVSWEEPKRYALTSLILGRLFMLEDAYNLALHAENTAPMLPFTTDVQSGRPYLERIRLALECLDRTVKDIVIADRNITLAERVATAAATASGRVYFIAGYGHFTKQFRGLMIRNGLSYMCVKPQHTPIPSAAEVSAYRRLFTSDDRKVLKLRWLARAVGQSAVTPRQ